MANQEGPFIPGAPFQGQTVCLSKCISALQLEPKGHGNGTKPGLLAQLGPGMELVVCGEGFNERTVKVRANGAYYFVFSQDIRSSKAEVEASGQFQDLSIDKH